MAFPVPIQNAPNLSPAPGKMNLNGSVGSPKGLPAGEEGEFSLELMDLLQEESPSLPGPTVEQNLLAFAPSPAPVSPGQPQILPQSQEGGKGQGMTRPLSPSLTLLKKENEKEKDKETPLVSLTPSTPSPGPAAPTGPGQNLQTLQNILEQKKVPVPSAGDKTTQLQRKEAPVTAGSPLPPGTATPTEIKDLENLLRFSAQATPAAETNNESSGRNPLPMEEALPASPVLIRPLKKEVHQLYGKFSEPKILSPDFQRPGLKSDLLPMGEKIELAARPWGKPSEGQAITALRGPSPHQAVSQPVLGPKETLPLPAEDTKKSKQKFLDSLPQEGISRDNSPPIFKAPPSSEGSPIRPSEMMDQIKNHLLQVSTRNEREMGVSINHHELGKVDLMVRKDPQNELLIKIVPQNTEGRDFFIENKDNIINNLMNSGFKVGDFKVESPTSSSSGDRDGASLTSWARHDRGQPHENLQGKERERRLQDLWEKMIHG